MIEKRVKKVQWSSVHYTKPYRLTKLKESTGIPSSLFWDFWGVKFQLSLSNHMRQDTGGVEHQWHIKQISLNRGHTNHSTWVNRLSHIADSRGRRPAAHVCTTGVCTWIELFVHHKSDTLKNQHEYPPHKPSLCEALQGVNKMQKSLQICHTIWKWFRSQTME